MSKSVMSTFSSVNFMISGLTFRSLIHFYFIFVYGVRKCSNGILIHIAVQFTQHHLLERPSFLHCIFLFPLPLINWPQDHELISDIFILSHWSMCLLLCQYHVVLIIVLCSIVWSLGCDTSIFVLFSLATWSLLWFHMNLRIICFSSVKTVMDILIH